MKTLDCQKEDCNRTLLEYEIEEGTIVKKCPDCGEYTRLDVTMTPSEKKVIQTQHH